MANTVQSREYSSNVVRVLHPTQTTYNVDYSVDRNSDHVFDNLDISSIPKSSRIVSNTTQNLNADKSNYVIKEHSKQNGKNVYHTVEYSMSSSKNSGGDYGENPSQLDTLLDDLKTEREQSNASGIYLENFQNTKNLNTNDFNVHKVYKNVTHSSNVHHTDLSPRSNLSQQVTYVDDNIDMDTRNTSKNLQSFSNNSQTITTTTSDLANDIKNIPLSDDILPVPGTKVTTTVRTYTYEVPLTTGVGTHNTYHLNLDEIDSVQDRTHVTRNVTSTLHSENTTQSSPVSVPVPVPVVQNYRVTETSNISNKNVSQNLTGGYPPSPRNDMPGHPDEVGRTYYYKNVTSNTKNTIYGIPKDNYPPGTSPHYPTGTGPHYPTGTGPNYPTGTGPNYPHDNYPDGYSKTHISTITSNTTNNVNYHPSKNINVQPEPFPTDEIDDMNRDIVPPKRLDDLMASFGPNDSGGRNYDTRTEQRVEVNTSLASPGTPQVEKTLSKNVQGPPVYYPPGQEMFQRKEESGAAWRAQGGYAKASGKYEYEAESSSKSKSKSGAAVVPVCLPLCCAMPCSIM